MHSVLNQTTNSEIKIEDGETIYDGFLKEGIDLPHGCLSGSCGACLIYVDECADNAISEPKTIESDTLSTVREKRDIPTETKIRLSCRARVHGNIKFSTKK